MVKYIRKPGDKSSFPYMSNEELSRPLNKHILRRIHSRNKINEIRKKIDTLMKKELKLISNFLINLLNEENSSDKAILKWNKKYKPKYLSLKKKHQKNLRSSYNKVYKNHLKQISKVIENIDIKQ